MNIRLCVSGFVAALMLVSCGGGGGGSSLPAAIPTIGPSTATPFSVAVAASSSVTKIGVASSAETGSPEHTIAVAPASAGCVASGAIRTCTASISLPTGAQTLTVTSYGATTVRSVWRTSLSGARVALAVGTAIAQISLDLAATQLAGGASGTTTLYVTARDANGNTIVGDFGGATIALTSSDTTGSVTLSSSTITAGGTPVTVTYNGSGNVSSVTFNATASGIAASAIVAASLSFTSSTIMYATSGNSVFLFPLGATGDVAPIRRMTFAGVEYVDGAAPDGNGNLWVLLTAQPLLNTNGSGVYGDYLATVPIGSSGVITAPNYLPASAFPANSEAIQLGVDGTGSAYVLSENLSFQYTVSVFAPGATSPTRTFTSSVFHGYCKSIDAATDGTVAVMCETPTAVSTNIYVFAPGASGAVSPVRTISGAATMLQGAAPGYVVFATDGSIVATTYSSTFTSAAVDVFAPGANGNVAPARRIAGPGTGLDTISLHVPAQGNGQTYGVGIDKNGQIYVGQYGSQTGITGGQILIFGATANGATPPQAILAGPLTGLVTDYDPIRFSNGVVPPAPATPASLSGDFLALAPSRGWNYALQTPQYASYANPVGATTLTLFADPTPVNGDTQLVVLESPGAPGTAATSSALVSARALFNTTNAAGITADGYESVTSGTTALGEIPIPGGLLLVPPTLTVGQTFVPYLGITGTVTAIGPVPGASACPASAGTTGATVVYAVAGISEVVTYVPGCGITSFISDGNATAVLQSIGSYPSVADLAHRRATASIDTLQTLRALWRGMFTPWSAK